MHEKYSAPDPAAAEAGYPASAVRDLLGRLLPRTDGALLLDALLAEDPSASADLPIQLDTDASPSARELARVRRLYHAGESAQAVRHAMSNTLTALQTEAQLLELEPLAEEHRSASTRIVELTRRLATVMRRLDLTGTPARAG